METITRRIVLFDIDGILLFDDNLGMTCFTKVLEKFKGIKEISLDYVPHGKTDMQILKELLSPSDGHLDKDFLNTILQYYIRIAKKTFNKFNIIALPGTINLIQHLHNIGIKIGILSGNVEEIGMLKLKKAGFDTAQFSFFSFGDIAEERSQLYKSFFDSLYINGKNTVENTKILVVGDTPNDIKCAQEERLPILAVASGNYLLHQLKFYKPDFILKDLNNISDFENILYSL